MMREGIGVVINRKVVGGGGRVGKGYRERGSRAMAGRGFEWGRDGEW